ncbi:hypothetical protein PNEG_02503 [Pneumocystis murina B123]|uniref:Mediator of RNA polymerase II transcription subunit 6 n=1 Tax=Pneumocystis murina (strain B123) TaxID=1069680 RepID=M7NKJ3_PNEMU|nr:hypothetical protein PNEG_02503 [Pneumocystis murina B123]EMR09163.1 hypothetical protein PNEG_02503 [Pneumocystis murina B123]
MIDLSVIAWRMPEWITAYGRLCTDNVLDYFSQSPFYDRHSNNEVLKMQTQFNTLGDFHGHLKKMRGIEFVISAEKDPDIWVIYKQHRSSENDASVLAAYFVANESIYMAPSIHSVISSRMLNIILSLRQALASVHNLHHFSSITEYSYSAPEVPSKEMPIHNIKANQHMRKALNDAIREKLYDMTQSKDETKQELQENSSDDHFKAKLDPTSTIVKKKKKTKKSESPASPKL